MKKTIVPPEFRLAPPGAGLPWVELQIARWLFGWKRWRTSRTEATTELVTERDAVLALARGCDSARAARTILIDRLRGIEDSSRNWSIFMTLDHLRIVNLAIAETIRRLGLGDVPPGTASTAAVKPDPAADETVVEGFVDSCARVATHAEELSDLHTARRYAHPWFGPLDAAAWHVMVGFHLALHRRQIEMILRRLEADGADGQ